jgi:signal transduction histidine kinase
MRLALARYFPQPNERGREVLERYIDRMSRVIGDMTDFVRIEQDALTLQLARIDMTRLVRDVVDAYVPDAAARRIKLTLEGFTSPVWAQVDAQRLLQVLSNVVDNALKFTPNGGTIAVMTIRSQTMFEIRVRDNGQGIAPDRLPYVFDLFAGAHGPRGLGIGLAVARRIIELHRGLIEVVSDGLDRGSEVIIKLPITESSRP